MHMERWNRKKLYDHLNSLYSGRVFSVGQHYQHDENSYVVLKSVEQSSDTFGSSKGGWQNYNIMCYVPDTSILNLDTMIEAIENSFKTLNNKPVEVTGVRGEDYHDTEIDMYMRYIVVRIPKEV